MVVGQSTRDNGPVASGVRAAPACVAGVLVGGRSRRMGRSKALLPHLHGGTLVEHVARVARTLATQVFLLGHADELPASLAGIERLPDARENSGPLAGLCSLLSAAGKRWALLTACDMPNLNVSLLTRLLAHATDDADAVAFMRADRPGTYHACCALYHPRLLPEALDELGTGKRSLQRLLGRARVAELAPDERDAAAFANVNTPSELESMLIPGR